MQPSFVAPPVPERARSLGALVGDALRRPGGRRAGSVRSIVLFLAGVVMFAYRSAPTSTAATSRASCASVSTTRGRCGLRRAAHRGRRRPDDAAVPKLDVKILVVQGTTPAALRAGAGHDETSPLAGEAGNVAIAPPTAGR